MALNFRPISILPVLSKLLERHVAVSLLASYLAIFEQGGSADIFSLITGGSRDDTSNSVIVTLSISGGATAPLPLPARYGPDF